MKHLKLFRGVEMRRDNWWSQVEPNLLVALDRENQAGKPILHGGGGFWWIPAVEGCRPARGEGLDMWTRRMLGFSTPVTRASCAAQLMLRCTRTKKKKEHSCGEEYEDEQTCSHRTTAWGATDCDSRTIPLPLPRPFQLVNIKILTCLFPNHYHPKISTMSVACMLSTYLLAMH